VIEISEELLQQIADRRGFEERTIEIARRLFLYGQTPKHVSIEFGINHQRVYAIRKQFLKAAETEVLPSGWAQATLVGPRSLVDDFLARFDEAMAATLKPPDVRG
jgi:hypothetical protein